jgi:hypothetical protein
MARPASLCAAVAHFPTLALPEGISCVHDARVGKVCPCEQSSKNFLQNLAAEDCQNVQGNVVQEFVSWCPTTPQFILPTSGEVSGRHRENDRCARAEVVGIGVGVRVGAGGGEGSGADHVPHRGCVLIEHRMRRAPRRHFQALRPKRLHHLWIPASSPPPTSGGVYWGCGGGLIITCNPSIVVWLPLHLRSLYVNTVRNSN